MRLPFLPDWAVMREFCAIGSRLTERVLWLDCCSPEDGPYGFSETIWRCTVSVYWLLDASPVRLEENCACELLMPPLFTDWRGSPAFDNF